MEKDCSNRPSSNGFKLEEQGFRLDISKKFFTQMIMRCWNVLPREAVDALSLEGFKDRLDEFLSNPI